MTPESRLLAEVRNTLGRLPHVRALRNNSGVFTDARGNVVRYGVPSTGGGSDLLGWQTVTITAEMVGQRFARFLALEIKSPRGRLTPEQENFLRVVAEAGGISGVVRTVEDALKLCNPQETT